MMQDICNYCDKCYGSNILGSSKYMCLNCLEHIIDNYIYDDINPLKNYNIVYNNDKITCEICNQSHKLYVTVTLCSKHKNQFGYLYLYENDCYDPPEDYYDYEKCYKKFNEIKSEIVNISKISKLSCKSGKVKDDSFNLKNIHCIFVYQNNRVVSKFIYSYGTLVLMFDDKIYTTSGFTDKFRDMYFCKLNYKLLDINEILSVFKNNFNIKYNQVKNFDNYIKIDDIVPALMDRLDIFNDKSIVFPK